MTFLWSNTLVQTIVAINIVAINMTVVNKHCCHAIRDRPSVSTRAASQVFSLFFAISLEHDMDYHVSPIIGVTK